MDRDAGGGGTREDEKKPNVLSTSDTYAGARTPETGDYLFSRKRVRAAGTRR